jgi:hypothetical protein
MTELNNMRKKNKYLPIRGNKKMKSHRVYNSKMSMAKRTIKTFIAMMTKKVDEKLKILPL